MLDLCSLLHQDSKIRELTKYSFPYSYLFLHRVPFILLIADMVSNDLRVFLLPVLHHLASDNPQAKLFVFEVFAIYKNGILTVVILVLN